MKSLILAQDLVQAMLQVIPELSFSIEAMKKATTKELFATSHALKKVLDGVPFRDAYREAAAELKDKTSADSHNLADQYSVEGFPGQTSATQIRSVLNQYRTWVEKKAG